jgi:hypothetical protein
MASSYDNNLRLDEMATGDGSGTWGTTTNTNLTLIADALGYQSKTVASASTDTLTIPNGTETDNEAISLYVKLTGGNQACTITVGPNTVKKLWIIENSTSQVITLTQGSGANVILAAGVTKMIYADGAGSGAALFDALASLEVGANFYIKNASTGDDSTAQLYLQTAEADIAVNDVLGKINFQAPNEGTGTDAILVAAAIQAKSEGDFSSSSNATTLEFMTGASEAATTKMSLSSGGNLDVTGDITGSTLNADGDTSAGDNAAIGYTSTEGLVLTGQGSTNDVTIKNDADADVISIPTGTTGVTLAGALTGTTATFTTADNSDQLTLKSTDADASSGPSLSLTRDSGSPADNDAGGKINFYFDDDGGASQRGAAIFTTITDVTAGSEDHKIHIETMIGGTEGERFGIGPTEVVVNEASIDLDFRVESNANANMLFVDGGNNNVTVQSTSAGAAQTPFIIHNASSDANTDVRMLLAPCTTAADRPVILSAKNNGSNVVDFGISTPNGGTPVQRVTVAGSDGTIDVETGDIFFSTAGKGICLGATSATAANTLHDYEEGTWTPRLGGSTAGVATPGSNNNGYYTKIGQFVHVTGFLVWSEITTSISGDVQLQGLPFTVSNVTGNFPSQPITRQFNGFTNGSSLYQAFQAAPGTSVAVVNGYSAGGSGQNWTTSITASASGNIYDINLSYITSD